MIKARIKRIFNLVRLAGEARYCPVCERSSSKFLRSGLIPRDDARCFHCGSLERHRLFWLYLTRMADFFSHPPERTLHIAPEGLIEKKFREALSGKFYITGDLFAPNVDVKMDITDIQFPGESFDFIYCSHALEHVPDDRKAMREFRRVLTNTGVAILLVPITAAKTFEDPSITDPEERLRLFGQDDHVRRYGPDYQDRLGEEGFKVNRISGADFLSEEEITKMGITETAGNIFICRR